MDDTKSKMTTGLFSNRTDEWATPRALFRELDQEFGFTLDVCATSENHTCDRYFTAEDDGLAQNWAGERVFCNPPYSHAKEWVRKCAEEARKPGTLVVMLIPARTDTSYFHDYIYHKAQEIRFIRGRLHFNDSKQGAPFPSMIVVF